MLEFMIGLFVGGFIGVFLMACLNAASYEDDLLDRYDAQHQDHDRKA